MLGVAAQGGGLFGQRGDRPQQKARHEPAQKGGCGTDGKRQQDRGIAKAGDRPEVAQGDKAGKGQGERGGKGAAQNHPQGRAPFAGRSPGHDRRAGGFTPPAPPVEYLGQDEGESFVLRLLRLERVMRAGFPF